MFVVCCVVVVGCWVLLRSCCLRGWLVVVGLLLVGGVVSCLLPVGVVGCGRCRFGVAGCVYCC